MAKLRLWQPLVVPHSDAASAGAYCRCHLSAAAAAGADSSRLSVGRAARQLWIPARLFTSVHAHCKKA
eukprot:372873-Pleurochrysis_carterae.AAC.1